MNRLSKFWIFNEPPLAARTNAPAARQHPDPAGHTAAARTEGRKARAVPPILADGRRGPWAITTCLLLAGLINRSRGLYWLLREHFLHPFRSRSSGRGSECYEVFFCIRSHRRPQLPRVPPRSETRRSSLAAAAETALSWASVTSRCLEEGSFSLTRASTAGMLHIRNAAIGVRTAQVPCTVGIANP